MIFHQIPVEDLIKELDTDIDAGLSRDEARGRLDSFGQNALQGKRDRTAAQKFIGQLRDVRLLILMAVAIVAFALAAYRGETEKLLEPVLILFIVLLNAIIIFIQKSKVEAALEKHKERLYPRAVVIRDGAAELIDARELVKGDVIFLEAGDFVPADARLISAEGLIVDESQLFDELLPVEKGASDLIREDAPITARTNMVYSSAAVSSGCGRAIVTAIGMDTEIAKTMGERNYEKPENTRLQRKLLRLGRYFGLLTLTVCMVIFFFGILDGFDAMDMVIIAISLAASAIPEGLAAMADTLMTKTALKMADRKIIVKSPAVVETLGGVNVICSDNSGALTSREMTVTSIWPTTAAAPLKFSGDMDSRESRALIGLAALCCDRDMVYREDENGDTYDPIEFAVLKAAHMMDMTGDRLRRQNPLVMELPFDSERRLMTTVHSTGDGQFMVISKGAVDAVGNCCSSGDYKRVFGINAKMARQGLRILAVAVKTMRYLPEEDADQAEIYEELESELQFLGLIGVLDPPRKDAVEAVMLCRRAGIRPVMITGDSKVTGTAIAAQLGIYRPGDRAVSGLELDEMEDSELSSCIGDISVYTKISMQDKLRVIKAWKSKDAVLAMTGDGVNDTYALKVADIGCAVGIRGTEAAVETADIVVADNDLMKIVSAVKFGRGFYDNIKKVAAYILGINVGGLLTMLLAMILWRVMPLISVQLLWLNLITYSFPALALGVEPVRGDVIDQKPRSKSESVLDGNAGFRVVIMGIIFAVLALSAFWMGYRPLGIEGGRTMAFIVLALSQLIHAFSMRSRDSLLKSGFLSNRPLIYSVLISLVMILVIVFVPPVAQAFGMVNLETWMYITALSLSIIPFPVMEILKAIGIGYSRG